MTATPVSGAVDDETAGTAMPPTDPNERARGVAVSAAAQLGAKAIHFLVNIVSSLAIIRYLAPADYGDYAIVLTTTLMVGLLADFGLPRLAVRDITRDGAPESQVLGSMVVARLGLAVVAVGVSQLVLLVVGASATAHLAGAVASALFFADSVLGVIIVFQVRVQLQYEAAIRLGIEVLETAILFSLIAMNATLPQLFLAPVLATTVGAAVAVVWARRRYDTTFSFDRGRLVHLVKESLPVGPALLIAVIYLKLDILLLGVLRTPTEVGLYSAAYQPIEYAFLATALVINVIFPILAQAFGREDLAGFARLYARGAEWLVAATLLVPVALVFTAQPLLEIVYSDAYGAASEAMIILAVALVLMAVNGYQACVLLAGGHQRATLAYDAQALVVALVLGFALIPWLGMNGASFAALGTAIFVLFASTRAIRSRLDTRLVPARMLRALAAAALAVLGLLVAVRLTLPWFAVLVLSVPLYAVALWATRFVGLSEVRGVLQRLSSSRTSLKGAGA